MGFSCSEAGSEGEFSAFMFKNLDNAGMRRNGRLYKYGKFNLFK
jgi:hypothetical protein